MHETMKFKNPTEHTLNLSAIGLGTIPPGGSVDVPLELCAPGRTDAGGRSKSAIECTAPQLVCDDPAMLDQWMAVPPPPEPRSLVVSVSARPAQEPAGVAALRAARAAAKAAPVKQSYRPTVPAQPTKPAASAPVTPDASATGEAP